MEDLNSNLILSKRHCFSTVFLLFPYFNKVVTFNINMKIV
ncbi:hypothetical protein SD78_0609 [Bacillus badius]|nr:hypothetical protein SD78_0609 [Bacillus badius]